MSRHSTAHHFLEGLVDLGVDYIFANLGTDHVSLIEELARWDQEGRKHPEMILCPHEVVAVHMAGGYALATGRGQAVLVHVDAGTANACMAIQNLFRYRLPVMLFAGRAPYTLHGELPGSRDTYVHFVQDPFDIASIVRPYVKWEYSLPSGIVVKEALARASAFAQSDPPGPVYMMLPRETLAEQWDVAEMPAYPPARYGGVHRRHRACAGRCDRASVDVGGKPDRTDGLSWPQAASGRRAGPAGAELRHPGRGIQFDRPQYLAGLALLRRLRSPAPVGTSRSRPAAGFGCAVHSAICQAR
ncbi:MAG TPA: thiamine pyrophosphate-binding protein, partial [Bradyrhizobium sp.]|nr:thiamine pyrophosphate-binding protein [Bradyrhizobium sp.]